jgi:hypothetical protein
MHASAAPVYAANPMDANARHRWKIHLVCLLAFAWLVCAKHLTSLKLRGLNTNPTGPSASWHLAREIIKDFSMSQKLIHVSLDNGDTALFLNGLVVHSLDANQEGESPLELGKTLSRALGEPLHDCTWKTPITEDWNWHEDVYAHLPVDLNDRAEATVSNVEVKHWACYGLSGTHNTHEMSVDDQRKFNGQLYLDLSTLGGHIDDMLSVTVEVNSNPLNGIDQVPCIHVHFDADALAFSLFKVGDRILMRPETHTSISGFQHQVGGVKEQLYWVDNNHRQSLFAKSPESALVREINMADLFEYEIPDQLPEWTWLEKNASFLHKDNGKSAGVWEMMLNLSKSLEDIPESLRFDIEQARREGVQFLWFHQGT